MNYMDTYHLWEAVSMEDPELARELEQIKGDDTQIKERFFKNLEFGTAGLRGILGVGTNRMNIYTVRRATQGMADYLNHSSEEKSVAIAYDSRINSELFARETACVFAANGITVHLFSELMPTPTLSYAVRRLHCGAGIVITASHNPAKYNGYKAYGADGCQLNPDAAAQVLGYAEKIDPFRDVKHISLEEGLASGSIRYIPEQLVQDYLDDVYKLRVNPQLAPRLHVVYTPLNGSGNRCVRSILGRMGVEVTVVPEQEHPDGNFPTCTYPNPEEKATLQLGIDLCTKVNGDLVLATDPDSDRAAIAVSHHGEFILPTGNELGILMLDYIARCRKEQGTLPKEPVMVKSVVSSPLTDVVAAYYGIKTINVLTGFKYIGEQISLLASQGQQERFVMGFEESCGYLTGDHVRDKDAVNASMIICEMAGYYKKQGKTLIDILHEIYARHGIYSSTSRGYSYEGMDGMQKMSDIMSQLRQNPPTEFSGCSVVGYADYLTGKCVKNNCEQLLDLPSSNILEYDLECSSRVIIRPSGTEPKIKVYLTIVASSRDDVEPLTQRLFSSVEQYLK